MTTNDKRRRTAGDAFGAQAFDLTRDAVARLVLATRHEVKAQRPTTIPHLEPSVDAVVVLPARDVARAAQPTHVVGFCSQDTSTKQRKNLDDEAATVAAAAVAAASVLAIVARGELPPVGDDDSVGGDDDELVGASGAADVTLAVVDAVADDVIAGVVEVALALEPDGAVVVDDDDDFGGDDDSLSSVSSDLLRDSFGDPSGDATRDVQRRTLRITRATKPRPHRRPWRCRATRQTARATSSWPATNDDKRGGKAHMLRRVASTNRITTHLQNAEFARRLREYAREPKRAIVGARSSRTVVSRSMASLSAKRRRNRCAKKRRAARHCAATRTNAMSHQQDAVSAHSLACSTPWTTPLACMRPAVSWRSANATATW